MAKSIFERLGGEYEQQGDYLIPCLITYTNLLTSGKRNACLAEIGRQAQERSHRLIENMKKTQCITNV